ncbi:MAG: hypothetical protein AAGJ46_08105 [Planctomycetota bacterium]
MLFVALFAVLSLLTLVAAYLGSKHWHWAHVLLVAALFFTAIGFTILAAESLRVRTKFQKQIANNEKRLEPYLELNPAVRRGTDDNGLISQLEAREVSVGKAVVQEVLEETSRIPGLVDLRHLVGLENRALGRVWRNVQPAGAVDQQTGQVVVAIEAPQPPGISQDAILYVFEQGPANSATPPQGRQYLGEFRAVSVADQQVTLEPVLEFDRYEADRLSNSRGPWSLYETMPTDRDEIFDRYTDEQLRQLLPAATVEEYLRDGTPWTVDDGEWTKQGLKDQVTRQVIGPDEWTDETVFVYQRRLRDYAFLFNDFAKEYTELRARQAALVEDATKLKATLARAKQIAQSKQTEQAALKFDLDGVQRELSAIESHTAAVRQQLAAGERLLQRLLASNARMADRLRQRQQELLGGLDLDRTPPRSRGAVDVDAL